MTQTRQSISRNWTCNYFICAQKTLKCGFPLLHFHPPLFFLCCFWWLMQKSSRHLCKVTCMFFLYSFVCLFEARRPAGGPGEAAGQAAAAVGEEVRPSAHGTSTPFLLRDAHVTLYSPKVRLRPPSLLLSPVPVWRRRAVCRAEGRADRQAVRLPPWSFLQLLPTEVLMNNGRLVGDGGCGGRRRTHHRCHRPTSRFKKKKKEGQKSSQAHCLVNAKRFILLYSHLFCIDVDCCHTKKKKVGGRGTFSISWYWIQTKCNEAIKDTELERPFVCLQLNWNVSHWAPATSPWPKVWIRYRQG